jgi:hypothetical protein
LRHPFEFLDARQFLAIALPEGRWSPSKSKDMHRKVCEQNYIRRPLDLLRMSHVKTEAWMLEQAGIDFVPVQAGLRAIK